MYQGVEQGSVLPLTGHLLFQPATFKAFANAFRAVICVDAVAPSVTPTKALKQHSKRSIAVCSIMFLVVECDWSLMMNSLLHKLSLTHKMWHSAEQMNLQVHFVAKPNE